MYTKLEPAHAHTSQTNTPLKPVYALNLSKIVWSSNMKQIYYFSNTLSLWMIMLPAVSCKMRYGKFANATRQESRGSGSGFNFLPGVVFYFASLGEMAYFSF
jgi:hypothetical protein